MTALDVIAIGRASVDLYGAQVGGRLEDMRSFTKHVGGSSANIAVGTARLGLASALIARVGDDPMGRCIRDDLIHERVEISGLTTDPERLTALVLSGLGDHDQIAQVAYRCDSADLALSEDDIDPDLIARARAVVASTAGMSQPQMRAAVLKAAHLARQAGARAALALEDHTSGGPGDLQDALPLFDLIAGTQAAFQIAGGSTDTAEALRAVRAVTGATLVCMRGADSAVAITDTIPDSLDGGILTSAPDIANAPGAGDGFMAGLLKGWLDGQDWPDTLSFAAACATRAASRDGSAPAFPSLKEMQLFLQRGSRAQARSQDGALQQLHWSTTRMRVWPDMRVFAFDHRMQLEDLPGATPEKIGAFKELCLQATLEVAQGRRGYGLLCDSRLGRTALHRAAGQGLWIGRPVEWPGSRPLAFEPEIGPDFGGLSSWPSEHVVKVLAFYHPGDPEPMRAAQEDTVIRLFHAARRNGLEFLLEVIPSKAGPVSDTTTADVIQRFYDLGVYPDWWKLEPMISDTGWAETCQAINRNDANTRGIVVLGLGESEDRLAASFAAAARHPLVKGFAVGRTIFGAEAKAFMSDAVSPEDAVRNMAATYARLCAIWDDARACLKESAA